MMVRLLTWQPHDEEKRKKKSCHWRHQCVNNYPGRDMLLGPFFWTLSGVDNLHSPTGCSRNRGNRFHRRLVSCLYFLHFCHGRIHNCRSLCAFELTGAAPSFGAWLSVLFGLLCLQQKKNPQATNILLIATPHLSKGSDQRRDMELLTQNWQVLRVVASSQALLAIYKVCFEKNYVPVNIKSLTWHWVCMLCITERPNDIILNYWLKPEKYGNILIFRIL